MFWCYIKAKWNHNIFTALFEKSKTYFFASLIMTNVYVSPARSRFPVKLVSCIAFGLTSSFSCLLRPIAVSLWNLIEIGMI